MRIIGLLLLLLLPALPAQAAGWVVSWATAPMAMEGENALPAAYQRDATIRQIVLLTLGGERLRIRLTNREGSAPLEIAGVSVARAPAAGVPAIEDGSAVGVTFSGRPAVTVPTGADFVSDPVALPVRALSHLAITIHYRDAGGRQTGHPGARTRSFLKTGDALADGRFDGATANPRWFHLAAVDVLNPEGAAVAILGDSITDGYGVETDSDTRWPDFLARRLQGAGRNMGVANLGIGGNRLLLDGLGPNAFSRLDRDVLAQSGVTHLLLLIGVNDLGTLTRDAPVASEARAAHLAQMLAAYRQIALRAREAGMQVIGGTITPYGASQYYHPQPADEATRQAINLWLRTPGNVDGVVDFDHATRDPAHPQRLAKPLDSGDGLHPSAAGYRAMAEAVPLALLAPAGPQLVLTFDDLPEHGPIAAGDTPFSVAQSLIATLRAGGVAHPVGFVNGARLLANPALAAVLTDWKAAGFDLANHGWAHQAASKLSEAEFTAELAQNETAMGKDMKRWFRFPYLDEGGTDAQRAAIRNRLKARGYSIAPVDLEFADWAYNGAYARCVAKGDTAAIARMESAFLADAAAASRQARANAAAGFGRDIPYVVLMHAGSFTARMLPRLLAMWQGMGFRFTGMEQALADPAHRAAADPSLPFAPSTLGQHTGLPGNSHPTDPATFCPA